MQKRSKVDIARGHSLEALTALSKSWILQILSLCSSHFLFHFVFILLKVNVVINCSSSIFSVSIFSVVSDWNRYLRHPRGTALLQMVVGMLVNVPTKV